MQPPADLAPGDYVMIAVSDTGVGMTADLAAHIFEPFFTTKGTGRGTGLGLSMVFGFMKQSGGHISVDSTPGAGATFRLYLPRAIEEPTELATSEEAPPYPATGETVLIVEDNDTLRRVVVRQLTSLGYRVMSARDATEALDALARGTVHLLFSDVVMPGEMDGFALVRHVRRRWPAVRVVLTSGFPDTKQPDDETAALTIQLLAKPYRKSDLARVLHDALT